MAASPARSQETWSLAATTMERRERVVLIETSPIRRASDRRVIEVDGVRASATDDPTRGVGSRLVTHCSELGPPQQRWNWILRAESGITAPRGETRARCRKPWEAFPADTDRLARAAATLLEVDLLRPGWRFLQRRTRRSAGPDWGQRSWQVHPAAHPGHSTAPHTGPRRGGRL